MTATLLRRFDRPDKGQTPTAGGLQVLGPITNAEDVRSAHVFVCWSREGYISEYDGNDKLVMEARFASVSLVTNPPLNSLRIRQETP